MGAEGQVVSWGDDSKALVEVFVGFGVLDVEFGVVQGLSGLMGVHRVSQSFRGDSSCCRVIGSTDSKDYRMTA